MTARSPRHLRKSAVQLTSMMDLLFVLLFAFMLKTSGDVEFLAEKATAEVFEELGRVNQEVRQLLFVKDENISLSQQLQLAQQKITDLEQSQREFSERTVELEQVKATDATKKIQAPRAGRWQVNYDPSDSYHVAEGLETFWVLRKVSEGPIDRTSDQTTKYVIQEEMRGQFGTIYESLTGQYDPGSNLLSMKTQGFTHADGRYRVERWYDPLGHVPLLNSMAQANRWGTFPSDYLGTVSRNGREMKGGAGTHPNPDRGLTGSEWTAVWLSP